MIIYWQLYCYSSCINIFQDLYDPITTETNAIFITSGRGVCYYYSLFCFIMLSCNKIISKISITTNKMQFSYKSKIFHSCMMLNTNMISLMWKKCTATTDIQNPYSSTDKRYSLSYWPQKQAKFTILRWPKKQHQNY